MTQEIKDLAISMNVSESDVLMFAQSIANGIERDKADEIYINSGKHIQADLVQAYAADAVVKFNNFQAILMTNKEAKEAFMLDVFYKLKKEEE